MNIEHIEKTINTLLLREITFTTANGKVLRTGTLVLFKFKDLYLTFSIKADNQIKVFELPYPFKIERKESNIVLSYSLRDLAANNDEIYFKSKLLTPKKRGKIFDSKITITWN